MTPSAAYARFDAISRGAAAARIVTMVFAAIVTWGAIHHEPWRDEVVPLSIARHAHSIADLVAMRVEGHPILWYFVLWCGWAVIAKTWVLKAIAIALAVGSVFLVNRSPLPWWIRWPFTFSLFPLYQYSVMSRGYGLEMFVLFAFCALYPRRYRRPVALALLLAALANTEMFGFVMAVAGGVMLVVEWAMGASDWRTGASRAARIAAVALYLAGLVLAFAVAFPSTSHPADTFQASDVAIPATAAAWALLQPAAHAARFLLLPYVSLWAWACFAYLAPQLPLLCFAMITLVGFETFYNLVYGLGAIWHLGNVVLVLVAVMWLEASNTIVLLALPAGVARARGWLGRVLAAGAVVLLADQVVMAFNALALDRRYDHSANRAFAELLRGDPALADAVVMGEPDTPLWSLSYYADNRIYLPREAMFRTWGDIRPGRARTYDLGSLLRAARQVHAECGCPVAVTLGWQLETVGRLVNFPGTHAEEHFMLTEAARDEFRASMRQVARLGPTITDENYDVYVLR